MPVAPDHGLDTRSLYSMTLQNLWDILAGLGVEGSVLDPGPGCVREAGGPVLPRAKVEEEAAIGGGVGEEEGEGGAGWEVGEGV